MTKYIISSVTTYDSDDLLWYTIIGEAKNESPNESQPPECRGSPTSLRMRDNWKIGFLKSDLRNVGEGM